MKIATFGRYANGAPAEATLEQWRTEQTSRLARVPGLRRFVDNTVTGSIDATGIGDQARAFDDYATAWFDDEASLLSAVRSPEWATALNGLVTPDQSLNVVVDPKVMRDESRDAGEYPFKVVWVCRFRRQDDRIARRQYWIEHHSALALRSPLIRRYVQNHVMGVWSADGVTGGPLPFDGFSECWFDDRAAFDAAIATQAWKDLDEDASELFDLAEIWNGWSGVLDETELVRPG